MNEAKPYCISKHQVVEAYRRVKANRGSSTLSDGLQPLPRMRKAYRRPEAREPRREESSRPCWRTSFCTTLWTTG